MTRRLTVAPVSMPEAVLGWREWAWIKHNAGSLHASIGHGPTPLTISPTTISSRSMSRVRINFILFTEALARPIVVRTEKATGVAPSADLPAVGLRSLSQLNGERNIVEVRKSLIELVEIPRRARAAAPILHDHHQNGERHPKGSAE